MRNGKPYPDHGMRWSSGGFSIPAIRTIVAEWLRRRATRRHLHELDDHRLDDVGLTRYQRDRECAKWFWE